MSWITDWLEAHPAPKPQARPQGTDVSYSQVRAYLDCPWSYKLRYVDFWKGPRSPRSAVGQSVHRTLEAYHREKASELERMLELYDENWVHEGFPTPQEQMEWHAKGARILETYWTEDRNRRSEILHVEREFQFPLGPHTVRGIIDRIDRRPGGDVDLIDYKTFLDGEPEIDPLGSLQLRIYGLGARECWGIEPAWLSLYFVSAAELVSVPCDEESEAEVRDLLHRVGDLAVHRKSFKPDTTACPRCDFRSRCTHSTALD